LIVVVVHQKLQPLQLLVVDYLLMVQDYLQMLEHWVVEVVQLGCFVVVDLDHLVVEVVHFDPAEELVHFALVVEDFPVVVDLDHLVVKD
jgi:hypothetical protein